MSYHIGVDCKDFGVLRTGEVSMYILGRQDTCQEAVYSGYLVEVGISVR